MKIPFVTRKYEGTACVQGFNWAVDEYTQFQLILRIWRCQWYFRMRRKSTFKEFSSSCPRFIFNFTFLDFFRDGYRRIDKKLDFWDNFELDLYMIKGVTYKYQELPVEYLEIIVKMYPSIKRYQYALADLKGGV